MTIKKTDVPVLRYFRMSEGEDELSTLVQAIRATAEIISLRHRDDEPLLHYLLVLVTLIEEACMLINPPPN